MEIFEAVGGGLVGVLILALMSLFGMLIYQLNARIADRDKAISERDNRLREQNVSLEKYQTNMQALTQAVNRQTDLMQSWMPGQQYRTVERQLSPPGPPGSG
jgi:uncharacterized coiled-coil protein SlyX